MGPGEWAALGTAAGAVLGVAGKYGLDMLKTRHTQGRETRRDAVEELFRLNDKLSADVSSLQDRADESAAAHARCEVQYATALERIGELTDAMRRAGIPVREWKPGGTDTHPALPDRRRGPDPENRGPDRRHPEGDR